MTIDYYLKYTGIPINFGITALLGFLVGTAIAGPDLLQLHAREPQAVRRPQGDGGDELPDRRHDPAPGDGRRPARLRARRRPGRAVRLADPGDASWPSTPPGSSCRSRRARRPDLHPVEPPERPARDRARAGDRLPLSERIGVVRAGRCLSPIPTRVVMTVAASASRRRDGRTTPRTTRPAPTVAVRIRGLTKHFGTGEQRGPGAAGRRLGRLRRPDVADRRPVGLRQDDAAVGHRRHPRLRRGRRSRSSARKSRR